MAHPTQENLKTVKDIIYLLNNKFAIQYSGSIYVRDEFYFAFSLTQHEKHIKIVRKSTGEYLRIYLVKTGTGFFNVYGAQGSIIRTGYKTDSTWFDNIEVMKTIPDAYLLPLNNLSEDSYFQLSTIHDLYSNSEHEFIINTINELKSPYYSIMVDNTHNATHDIINALNRIDVMIYANDKVELDVL